MKAALLQMTSGDDPARNLTMMSEMIRTAAASGAEFVLTPEVCNCVSMDRAHQEAVLTDEDNDPTLAGLKALAAELDIWLLIGSLALKTNDPDGRFANRSVLISPEGEITGTYDKIHMFDVELSETEAYRESNGYRPGSSLTLIETDIGKIGLTICYDLRFPHIFRALAQAGAEIICVPSAFAVETGKAHWEPLLRARAIENGVYILAPAQTGTHPTTSGRSRRTYGHSLAVDPWGKMIAKSEQYPDIVHLDIHLRDCVDARTRIPSLLHDRTFTGPL